MQRRDAHSRKQASITAEKRQTLGQSNGVAGSDQKAVDTIGHELRNGSRRRAQGGKAMGHTLQVGNAKTLELRRNHEGVCLCQDRGKRLMINNSMEVDRQPGAQCDLLNTTGVCRLDVAGTHDVENIWSGKTLRGREDIRLPRCARRQAQRAVQARAWDIARLTNGHHQAAQSPSASP
jgi:hypothetical protein